MISDGFNFDFAASDSPAIDPATASIGSCSVNPAIRSDHPPVSNVFANHSALHAGSAVQENSGTQSDRRTSIQIVTKRNNKRKFSCVLQEDSLCESDDDDITIVTGFEDGVLSSVLSKQTEFDQNTFMEEIFKERLINEMNRWEQIKEQTRNEIRANGETSTSLAIDNMQKRTGDTRRQLTFNWALSHLFTFRSTSVLSNHCF